MKCLMKRLLVLAALALFSHSALANDTPDPPPLVGFAVVPEMTDEDVTCAGRDELQPVFGWKNPESHTHTDAAGHTWDHTTNAGHVCNIPVPDGRGGWRTCGLVQTNKDSRSRLVMTVTYRSINRTLAKSAHVIQSIQFAHVADPPALVGFTAPTRPTVQAPVQLAQPPGTAATISAAPLMYSQSFGTCSGAGCSSASFGTVRTTGPVREFLDRVRNR